MYTAMVITCCLAALVSGRPDVSLGYHYNPDYNSGSNLLTAPVATTFYYPTASGSVGAVNPGGFDSGAATSSSNSGNFLAPDYNVGGVSSAVASSFASGGGSSASAASSSFANSGSFGGGDGSGFNSATSNSASSVFNTGSTQGGGQGYIGGGSGISQGPQQQYAPQYPQQPPIITKQFYVHTAPEDHDNQEIVRYVTIGRPTKNYRVVFINAPSSSSTKAKIIASVAPNEDRTAIYVLSKKANELDISADVVTPPPSPANKPDVFFIKYKTPEEAIHAQHVIQAQYDKLGGSSNFSNEGNIPVQSVIGSLGSSQGNAGSSAFAQGSSQTATPGFSQNQGPTQQVVSGGSAQPQGNYLPPTIYRRRRYYRY